MRTILTILLTSLVWAFIILCFFEPRSTEQSLAPSTVEVVETTPPPTKSQKRSENKSEKKNSKQVKNDAKQQVSKATPATASTTASATTSTTTQTSTTKSVKNTEVATSAKSTNSTESAESTNGTENAESIDYAREIEGKWMPIEGAEHTLEITKYGVAIQNRGYQNRVKCNLKGKKLAIQYDNARCEITKENGYYYLEIYNSKEFSGKYKRLSQPRKIAMRPLDNAQYGELIVGKWNPINGQEYPLEFSKYGTAIQSRGYENRVEYTLNGSSLKIQYDNARVVISESSSHYYLEIYNSTDFAGRYRKSK